MRNQGSIPEREHEERNQIQGRQKVRKLTSYHTRRLRRKTAMGNVTPLRTPFFTWDIENAVSSKPFVANIMMYEMITSTEN